jgi:hypothetical protein
VSDTTRLVAERTPARRELGLPEDGFVFCCFNNDYKITAPMFDVWMRLLQQVPSSVLWLRSVHPGVESNLRQEAAARRVAPARVIFARRTASLAELCRAIALPISFPIRRPTMPTRRRAMRCGGLAAPHPLRDELRRPRCREPAARGRAPPAGNP